MPLPPFIYLRSVGHTMTSRRSLRLAAPLLVAALAAGLMASTPASPDTILRVCADPFDLPFSNDKEEGFENKLARIVARDLGYSLQNFWWPHRRGFLNNSLRPRLCDVILGVPVGFDPVRTTKPYYRSTYDFVYRSDRNLHISSLDDTILKHLRIGVNLIGYDYTNTPPAHALGVRGVVGNLVGFYNFLDPARDHPEDIVEAVAKDSVDVAIVWGPLAGYWSKRASVPLTLVALPDSDPASGMIFGFDMAMGVRHADKALAAQLDSVIDKDRAEILGILRDYNVPLLEVRTASQPAPAAPRDSMLVSDQAYQGWKWFHVYCYRCHGTDALGGQLAPDLRHSVGPEGSVTHDVFLRTATDGRPTKGMPSWKALLDSTQIEELYAYVRARSDGSLPPGRPHRASDVAKP